MIIPPGMKIMLHNYLPWIWLITTAVQTFSQTILKPSITSSPSPEEKIMITPTRFQEHRSQIIIHLDHNLNIQKTLEITQAHCTSKNPNPDHSSVSATIRDVSSIPKTKKRKKRTDEKAKHHEQRRTLWTKILAGKSKIIHGMWSIGGFRIYIVGAQER